MKKNGFRILVAAVFAAVMFLPFGGMSAVASTPEVYLGGTPIGVTVECDGLIVDSIVNVAGEKPTSPAAEAGILPGDKIIKINQNPVKQPSDIGIYVNSDTPLELTLIRAQKEWTTTVHPKYDQLAHGYKLGLHVKNEIAGVGTLTYVRADNGRFGGLGHKIYNREPDDSLQFQNGYVYPCKILSVLRGERGKPGELRGYFAKNDQPNGTIDKNTFCGIFGKSEENLTENLSKIAIGGRKSVRPGKAKIFTTIEGSAPDYYDIEIVKATRQNEPEDKSMVLHVTDERLLKTTGGIVQGMSGSPIIQDGKLVGAVTHVFINDPTRGYGIYIEWMLPN